MVLLGNLASAGTSERVYDGCDFCVDGEILAKDFFNAVIDPTLCDQEWLVATFYHSGKSIISLVD